MFFTIRFIWNFFLFFKLILRFIWTFSLTVIWSVQINLSILIRMTSYDCELLIFPHVRKRCRSGLSPFPSSAVQGSMLSFPVTRPSASLTISSSLPSIELAFIHFVCLFSICFSGLSPWLNVFPDFPLIIISLKASFILESTCILECISCRNFSLRNPSRFYLFMSKTLLGFNPFFCCSSSCRIDINHFGIILSRKVNHMH